MSTPVRTCVGCRQRRPIDALMRLTVERVGDRVELVVDGPSSGRGAWLCRSGGRLTTGGGGFSVESGVVVDECRRAALQRGGFARAWRTVVADELVRRIEELPGRGVDDDVRCRGNVD